MVMGLNHNFRCNGKIYHVQTEAYEQRGFVVTEAYCEGGIVESISIPLDGLSSRNADDQKEMLQLMKDQHRAVLMKIAGVKRKRKTVQKMEAIGVIKKSARSSADDANAVVQESAMDTSAAVSFLDEAKGILFDLISHEGVLSLGVFTPDMRSVAQMGVSDIDLQEIVQVLNESVQAIQKVSRKNNLDPIDVVTLRSKKYKLLFADFSTYFSDSSAPMHEVLKYVVICIDSEVSSSQVQTYLDQLMKAIAGDLTDFLMKQMQADDNQRGHVKEQEMIESRTA